MLAIAGAYLAELLGGRRLLAAARLGGFHGAEPSFALDGSTTAALERWNYRDAPA